MKLKKLTLALIAYTLLVIIWGAWVRISHSGDGCGNHWPLCRGEFIPGLSQTSTQVVTEKKTWVEYTHRLMSGTFGILIIWLWFWARKKSKLGLLNSATQKMTTAALIFMIIEALLGAKLVLLGLVRENDSALRVIYMSLHMINSLLLVGSIAMIHENADAQKWQRRKNLEGLLSRQQKKIFQLLSFLFIIIAVTGAIAALASTLFPSESLLQGLQNDFDSGAHFLVRARLFHPLLAWLLGSLIAVTVWLFSFHLDDTEFGELKIKCKNLTLTIGIGLLFGTATLFLLSPIWMKLTHLLIAHLIWIQLLIVIRNIFWQKNLS